MSQAIVEPEALRRFAAQLERSRGDLQSQAAATMGAVAGVSETWRDQKYAEFHRALQDAFQVLRLFYLESESEASYLRGKADLAQRYLDGR